MRPADDSRAKGRRGREEREKGEETQRQGEGDKETGEEDTETRGRGQGERHASGGEARAGRNYGPSVALALDMTRRKEGGEHDSRAERRGGGSWRGEGQGRVGAGHERGRGGT